MAGLLAGFLFGAAAPGALAHGDEGARPVVLRTAGQLRTIVAATLTQAGSLAPASQRGALSASIIQPLEAVLAAAGSISYDILALHEALRYAQAKGLTVEETGALLADVALTVAKGGVAVGTLREYLERARGERGSNLAPDVLALVRRHVDREHADSVNALLESAEEAGRNSTWILTRLQDLG